MAQTRMAPDQVQLQNWEKKQESLEGDQKQILEALQKIGPATGEKVAQHIGTSYHRISGRFGELQDQERIKVKEKKQNQRGYLCKVWKVKTNE